jgi:hypothetical protein
MKKTLAAVLVVILVASVASAALASVFDAGSSFENSISLGKGNGNGEATEAGTARDPETAPATAGTAPRTVRGTAPATGPIPTARSCRRNRPKEAA